GSPRGVAFNDEAWRSELRGQFTIDQKARGRRDAEFEFRFAMRRQAHAATRGFDPPSCRGVDGRVAIEARVVSAGYSNPHGVGPAGHPRKIGGELRGDVFDA